MPPARIQKATAHSQLAFAWLLTLAAFFVMALPSVAAPLRIATWNLREPAATATNDPSQKTADARIQDAAVALGRLDPDVIILQQVRDWQMCQQVVQALQPAAYSVQVCSSFRDARTGTAGRQQIAILSKRKAYFSWSEPWRAEGQPIAGGFTFAALRLGKQRIGLFAVQLGDTALTFGTTNDVEKIAQAREACLQQWVRELGSFKQWVTNRIEAVVVAGGLNDLPGEERPLPHPPGEIEFARKLMSAPLQSPTLLPDAATSSVGTNYVFARLNPDADSLTGVILDRCPAACDVELTLEKPSPAVVARNDSAPSMTEPPHVPQVNSSHPAGAARESAKSAAGTPAILPNRPVQTGQAVAPRTNRKWLAGIGAVIILCLAALWMLRGRRSRRRPQPAGRTLIGLGTDTGNGNGNARQISGTVIITTQSVTGSADIIPARPIVRIESETEQWRRRALAAEERADKHADAMRRGLMPQMRRWLKEKLTRKLIADRSELLETQQTAALKAMAVDERLSKIESQIQQQNAVYQRRIDELIRELAAAKEENRELIRAKIAQVKFEMEAARTRALQQAKD
ncbi:MAG TPA: hypothetical protein VN281_01100 [Verrucomicrobiae bacterium]|nr:hypothetical protein [Verrucomicrobiae bacterium]